MDKQKEIRTSKFLSLVLRHKPEVIGITMDENGWVEVDELLQKMASKGKAINFEELQYIVANNNKKRFTFNEDQSLIRANQGHSIDINLALKPKSPPNILYHGTATRFLESIQQTGLEKRSRQHVHLSADKATAAMVGKRHGKLVILEIKATEMQKDGFDFFCSKNGVWLTDKVPVPYLIFPSNE